MLAVLIGGESEHNGLDDLDAVVVVVVVQDEA
jgi:hypothetical protein